MDGWIGWMDWMDGWMYGWTNALEICYMLKDSPGIPNYPGYCGSCIYGWWMDEWIQLGQKMCDG